MWRVLILSSLLLAAQGACGGAKSRPVAGPPDPRLQDIERLSRELRDLQRDECPPGEDAPDYVQDVCDNREETCRIADDVADNAWAAEKCATARRACRSAQTACYGLTARPQIF